MRWIAGLLLCAATLCAQERDVIVLHEKQFLPMGNAYDAFCRKNGGKKRSILRAATTRALKMIADKEQPALLKALGNPDGARRLWLVNAVVVRLTEEQIRKAKGLGSVKFVYPAGRVPPDRPPGKVAELARTVREKPSTSGIVIVTSWGPPTIWPFWMSSGRM